MTDQTFANYRRGWGVDGIPTDAERVEQIAKAREIIYRPGENCAICWANDDRRVPAVAMCSELNKAVCVKHAAGCKEDGHEARPFGEDD